MNAGRPSLATITVGPGELVYAGELFIDYGTNTNCTIEGNWMTDNESRQYCGAEWMSLRVSDASSPRAKPFVQKHLGPGAAERLIVRLAEPGSMVSAK